MNSKGLPGCWCVSFYPFFIILITLGDPTNTRDVVGWFLKSWGLPVVAMGSPVTPKSWSSMTTEWFGNPQDLMTTGFSGFIIPAFKMNESQKCKFHLGWTTMTWMTFNTLTLSGHWKLHWAFGICEEVSEREKFPSRLGTYSATGNREQKIESMTSLWMGQRNPATTKRMVETCWNPINNGILAIYQLVQDFASIRSMSSLCDCFLYPKTGESASWAQTRFRVFWVATLVANLLLFGGVHGEGSV